MSTESVKKIIGRAVTEPEYRGVLFSDPDKALAGYDLTEEEAAALKGLEREKFDAVAGELEERISKSGLRVAEFVFDDDLWGRFLASSGYAEATPISIP